MPNQTPNQLPASVLQSCEEMPQQVSVPAQSLISLREIFLHLETMADKQEQMIAAFDPQKSTKGNPEPTCATKNQSPGSISVAQLAQQVISSTRANNRLLATHVENLQLMVLINPWSIIEKLWNLTLPDFRLSLLQLFYLQDLSRLDLNQVQIQQKSLGQHWNELATLKTDLQYLVQQQSSRFEFSDVLEQRLSPWIREFDQYLVTISKMLPGGLNSIEHPGLAPL